MMTQQTPNMDRPLRLVGYLREIAGLRSRVIRDVESYERLLWFEQIPKEKGCFTKAWGPDNEHDPDCWLEVTSQPEPKLPPIPDICRSWVNLTDLRNIQDLPVLREAIVQVPENSDDEQATDQQTLVLADHPEIETAWEHYLEEQWLPWADAYKCWTEVHTIYSKLFSFYQSMLRLGEEYELVVGLGLLNWRCPSGQKVKRHLVVAEAQLNFEAKRGSFTLGPAADGASLHTELDMLDLTEQPPIKATDQANALLQESGDNPWQREKLDAVLQILVHSLDSRGEYQADLDKLPDKVGDKPVVHFAPTLILRKRSAKGLLETLSTIEEQLGSGTTPPLQFADLAELEDKNADTDTAEETSHSPTPPRNEPLYFPKPSNEEQRSIIDWLHRAGGVLVQGPPGTGKSHTIANLICHLLASGKRLLITSKNPRALGVIDHLLPEEIRPLCINLLGSGLEEKQSLERSITTILAKHGTWNSRRSEDQAEKLEKQLQECKEERAALTRRIRTTREMEVHSQTVARGQYRGTAARIAEQVQQQAKNFSWLEDKIEPEAHCPVSPEELQEALASLAELYPLLPELAPDKKLPSPELTLEEFDELIDHKQVIEAKEVSLRSTIPQKLITAIQGNNQKLVNQLKTGLQKFLTAYDRLTTVDDNWSKQALVEILAERSEPWQKLYTFSVKQLTELKSLAPDADQMELQLPAEENPRAMLDAAKTMQDYFEAGGKLGWGPFRSKTVKEHGPFLDQVQLNGRFCHDAEQCKKVQICLNARLLTEELWQYWAGKVEHASGPYGMQFPILLSHTKTLARLLKLKEKREHCRKLLAAFPRLEEPDWSNTQSLRALIKACEYITFQEETRTHEERLLNHQRSLVRTCSGANIHPCGQRLPLAFQNRDRKEFQAALEQIEQLRGQRERLEKAERVLQKLADHAPLLATSLRQSPDDPCWQGRLNQLEAAFAWAQARWWLSEFLDKDKTLALSTRLSQIEEEILSLTGQLAALRGWNFCFSRLSRSHRSHMTLWQDAMRRLGKGTGKHAPRHRKTARRELTHCREAVPAWIIPLHRVWDTVDPAPELFDVIIVDEASQCGLESLPLFYMAKKLLIVGDDKQISPEAVGIDQDVVQPLMDRYLHDFTFKSAFELTSSLFDQGRVRFSGSRVSLREHFRCMPEIIHFSNDLCYRQSPLIPLRQYPPDRLPPLVSVFVETGYSEGKASRIINRPEAEAIVERIACYCQSPAYEGKTMGVVILQGEAQAGLIEELLIERIGTEEMLSRRLICGNPYSFQGDERDIIFCSLVVDPNRRIASLTKESDMRRFNVATSRARDQLVLFHSVQPEDLGSNCLRRRLLEHFQQPITTRIDELDTEELERRALRDQRDIIKPPSPFDSWFELDVALEMLRRNYRIIPQYAVAGKRIDLVVEGGKSRLAVECDGDHWHGLEQYEADMQRQRQLERCGWEFCRIRESHFYANREKAMEPLWQQLEERGIMPLEKTCQTTTMEELPQTTPQLAPAPEGAKTEEVASL